MCHGNESCLISTLAQVSKGARDCGAVYNSHVDMQFGAYKSAAQQSGHYLLARHVWSLEDLCRHDGSADFQQNITLLNDTLISTKTAFIVFSVSSIVCLFTPCIVPRMSVSPFDALHNVLVIFVTARVILDFASCCSLPLFIDFQLRRSLSSTLHLKYSKSCVLYSLSRRLLASLFRFC